MMGDQWRIGDEKRVRIWQDPWVPEMSPLPNTHNTLGLDPQTTTVDMLMECNSSYWNLTAPLDSYFHTKNSTYVVSLSRKMDLGW